MKTALGGFTRLCVASKAAKTTTGEVIKQAAGKGCEGGKLWGIASPVCPWGSSQKGPLIPQHELSFAIQIRLRSERPRQASAKV
jgi:hypothetical protein